MLNQENDGQDDSREPSDNVQENLFQSVIPETYLTGESGLTYRSIKRKGIFLFLDQTGRAYAWIQVENSAIPHWECVLIKSRKFNKYLRENAPPGTKKSELKNIALELDAIAYANNVVISLENRFAQNGGTLYLDLCDYDGNIVEITAQGFKVVQQTTPIFTRYTHQEALPNPIIEDDPMFVFRFLPVPEDPQLRLLILVWILSALHQLTESAILLVIGMQGSGKSTFCRALRSIIDPSKNLLLGTVERRQLPLLFQENAVPVFENVGEFNRSQSDTFCPAATGVAFQLRKLFTDDETVTFSFRRPIVINGISHPTHRPDFLDRCLVVPLDRLEIFRPQQEVEAEFRAAHPRILGSILTLLSKTLPHLAEQKSESSFRMASFARFGRAVAVALGKAPEDFDKAYQSNLDNQSADAADVDIHAQTIMKLASSHPSSIPWEGPVTKLINDLESLAYKMDPIGIAKELTKSPKEMSKKLTEIGPLLKHSGTRIIRLPRTKSGRHWKIFNVGKTSNDNQSTSEGDQDNE